MSLEQLAAATKIPRRSIELLEDDRYAELPGQVFVKGFLRCCARALGLDPNKVMELAYERERASLQAARRRERPTTGTHPTQAHVSRRSKRAQGASDARRPVTTVTAAAVGRWSRILPRVSAAQLLLWVVVGLFVAIVVLAVFNVVGGSAAPMLRG